MGVVPADIRRGPMSADERREIERLAGTLSRPTPSAISRRLNRHVATVTWYMLTRGLLQRQPRPGPHRPYLKKDGTQVNPWTPDQDRRLTELSIQGHNYRQTAEILTQEFGIPRNAHKVQVRAVLLAAAPDAEPA